MFAENAAQRRTWRNPGYYNGRVMYHGAVWGMMHCGIIWRNPRRIHHNLSPCPYTRRWSVPDTKTLYQQHVFLNASESCWTGSKWRKTCMFLHLSRLPVSNSQLWVHSRLHTFKRKTTPISSKLWTQGPPLGSKIRWPPWPKSWIRLWRPTCTAKFPENSTPPHDSRTHQWHHELHLPRLQSPLSDHPTTTIAFYMWVPFNPNYPNSSHFEVLWKSHVYLSHVFVCICPIERIFTLVHVYITFSNYAGRTCVSSDRPELKAKGLQTYLSLIPTLNESFQALSREERAARKHCKGKVSRERHILIYCCDLCPPWIKENVSPAVEHNYCVFYSKEEWGLTYERRRSGPVAVKGKNPGRPCFVRKLKISCYFFLAVNA